MSALSGSSAAWQPPISPKEMKSTQTLIVIKANMPVSKVRLAVVVEYFFLSIDIRVFTLMKKDPKRPPRIPSTIGP